MATSKMIEAYGYMGTRRVAFRKTFKSFDALRMWCVKNNAEYIGTREVSAEEVRASARARLGLVNGMGKLFGRD